MALKIATAESDYAGHELKILRHIATEQQQHSGRSHVLNLLDAFEHRGPNGIHECFVFEVMGSSFEAYVMDSREKIAHPSRPLFGPQKQFDYTLLEVKSVLRQVLLGIDFLHKCGIGHSDLQPGNLLASNKDLSSIEESHLAQYDDDGAHFVAVADKFVRTYKDDRPSTESGSPRAKRRKTSCSLDDTKSTQEPLSNDHKPRYLALKRPLDDVVELARPTQVKVCDTGGAFFLSSPPN